MAKIKLSCIFALSNKRNNNQFKLNIMNTKKEIKKMKQKKMKEEDYYYYITLYTNNVFKGRFILLFKDAKQIVYWWTRISRHNSVKYEKITNNI